MLGFFFKLFASDNVKKALMGIGMILAVVVAVAPPEGQIYKFCMAVIGALAGLGLVSGGTSGMRSDESRQVLDELVEKGVVAGPDRSPYDPNRNPG